MNVLKGLCAGLIGGLVGAVLWAVVAHYTNREIGWLAWGVGALVGAGARWGHEQRRSVGLGLACVLVALVSICVGKYVTAYWETLDFITAKKADPVPDEAVQMSISFRLVREAESAGTALNWPDGKDADSAEDSKDLPPEIWGRAQDEWRGMSPADRETKRDEVKREFIESMEKTAYIWAGIALLGSFGPIDILWAFLSAASAYRIGSGTRRAAPAGPEHGEGAAPPDQNPPS